MDLFLCDGSSGHMIRTFACTKKLCRQLGHNQSKTKSNSKESGNRNVTMHMSPLSWLSFEGHAAVVKPRFVCLCNF
eukprot:6474524-Amphidinium_carterae.1